MRSDPAIFALASIAADVLIAAASEMEPRLMVAADGDNALETNTAAELPQIARDWLAPVLPFFRRLLAAAEDSTISDAELQTMLETDRKKIFQLKPDADALQKHLEAALGAAVLNGVLHGFTHRGHSRKIRNALKAAAADSPLPMQDAIDKLGRKTIIGSKLSSSEWSDVPAALRERAWFSSRVENVQFLQRARNLFDDFLQNRVETVTSPEGVTSTALASGGRQQFVRDMQRFALEEGMDELVAPKDRGGLKDITSEKRLSLIFRTQQKQMADYGNWRQGMDPDVLDEFPAQRFIRVADVKEPRPDHEQYEDQVYLKTDTEAWTRINDDFGVPWGPWGWGCGHDVEDVDRKEAESLGLIEPGESVQAETLDANDGLQTSVADLDPDLVDWLKTALAGKVRQVGDALEWIGGPS